MVEENSRKSLLNTLDKTLLLIGNICSKTSGENLLKELGKLVKFPLENLREKQCPNPQIYRGRKTSRWDPGDLSVDRPVDRSTVIFSDR